jgi:hypothetical protein
MADPMTGYRSNKYHSSYSIRCFFTPMESNWLRVRCDEAVRHQYDTLINRALKIP